MKSHPDYLDVLGVEFKRLDTESNEATLFIVAIDPEIGITAYGNFHDDLEDTEPYEMLCLPKDMYVKDFGEVAYKKKFDYIVDCVRSGKVYKLSKCIDSRTPSFNLAKCAFK